MLSIRACELPPEALLQPYRLQQAYTDCYVTEIPRPVSHAQFVEAFYTTVVFKAERLVLRLFAARLSTDAQVRQLAAGDVERFAAWQVEARHTNQLLLRDVTGRTRSWLMVEAGSSAAVTRLYFGSAVVPLHSSRTGQPTLGAMFRALLGFHQVYSRVLLAAARRRLAGGGG